MALASVIKYEGDNKTFVWKHDAEDFNTNSQLIVHENQEAVLFLNGQPLDLFGSGRYTLQTQNIPLLRKLINLPTGDETPFHCEVYFINKVDQMAIQWGTDSKVQYVDPTYGFPLSIGASGTMTLRASDSKKLLVKLVGTEKELSQERLVSYFRGFLMTKVKAYIAQTLTEQRISVFGIDAQLMGFSDALKSKLEPDFYEYGISLEHFFVTTIVKPDGDPLYEQFKSLHFRQYADVAEARLRQQVGVIDQETAAQKLVIESHAIAEKRNIEGYTYEKERMFDVTEKAAQNEGTGNFGSLGIGLGIMTGVGANIGSVVNDSVKKVMSQEQSSGASFCDNCGEKLEEGMQYCDNCGTAVSTVAKCSCGFVFERTGKFCPRCGKKREVSQ